MTLEEFETQMNKIVSDYKEERRRNGVRFRTTSIVLTVLIVSILIYKMLT